MTPDERQLLKAFLADLAKVSISGKDAEAASLIGSATRGNEDAVYALVQHAILSNRAIEAAQSRIVELERQQDGTRTGAGSFLGGGSSLGGSRGVWGPPPSAPAQTYAPAQPYPAAGPAPYQGGQGGGGGFLRNVAATAAGVVGGEFLFAGLSNLIGGHHLGAFGGADLAQPVENITVNEYFAAPGQDAPGYDPGLRPDAPIEADYNVDPGPGGDFSGGDIDTA